MSMINVKCYAVTLHWKKRERGTTIMTAENLLVLLDEIRNLIHEHSDKDGHMDCDSQKVYLALELAKKELLQTQSS